MPATDKEARRMSERVIESASGALRLRVTIERADLFAMTEADRDAFDAVRDALDRLGEAVIVKVDDPAAAVEDRLVAAASKASLVRQADRTGHRTCRWCEGEFTSKGVHHHEKACRKVNDPGYADELRARAAAPIVLDPVDKPARPMRRLEPVVDDVGDLARLAAAVRASGADPTRLGAVSAMFLHDALACDGDLADFLRRTPERTIVLARRELRLEDDDPTLPWLQSFLDAYRAAEAAA